MLIGDGVSDLRPQKITLASVQLRNRIPAPLTLNATRRTTIASRALTGIALHREFLRLGLPGRRRIPA